MPRHKSAKKQARPKTSSSTGKDELLLDLAKNPMFKELSTRKNKIRIDKRFEHMLNDKRFNDRDFRFDKRGKPIRGRNDNFASRIYEISDEEGSSEDESITNGGDDEENFQQDRDSEYLEKLKKNEKINLKKKKKRRRETEEELDEDSEFDENVEKAVKEEKEDDESEKEEEEEGDDDSEGMDDGEECSSDEERLPPISLDLARGEAPDLDSSSSDGEQNDNDEESDDGSNMDEKGQKLDVEEDGVLRVEWASSRLAICNMDWNKMSAEALLIVIQSLKPTSGLIQSVSVYLSDFGIERLEKEKVNGPNIVLKASKKRSDNDLEERTRQAIQAYEMDRLRYYYAVCECDTMETATAIYEACDGVEYEESGVRFDFRFIPDDMKFEENRLRDRASPNELNLSRFKPKNVKTHPLLCTNPKISWEEGDLERKLRLRNAFEADTKLEEFDTLVAASSDEDETAQKKRYEILISAARESAQECGNMFSVKQFSNKGEENDGDLEGREEEEEKKEEIGRLGGDCIVEEENGSNEDEEEDLAVERRKLGVKRQTKFQQYLERKKQIKMERKKEELEQRKERKRRENDSDDGDYLEKATNSAESWQHVQSDVRFGALFKDSAFAIDKTHAQYKGGDLATRQVYGKISQKRHAEESATLRGAEDDENKLLVERLMKKQRRLQQREENE